LTQFASTPSFAAVSESDQTQPNPKPKHVVLYDSDCSMCTFQMKTLTWLDWFRKVRFLAIKDPEAAELAPDLGREDLMEAIHCLATNGKVHRGARAIRFLGMRMPLLVPMSLILWFPGVILLAELAYKFVSKHRLFFSKFFGCKGACAIMPERKDSVKSEP
jgi:predicted DCC family thiol-disulfide oxidoreductase YuxK